MICPLADARGSVRLAVVGMSSIKNLMAKAAGTEKETGKLLRIERERLDARWVEGLASQDTRTPSPFGLSALRPLCGGSACAVSGAGRALRFRGNGLIVAPAWVL